MKRVNISNDVKSREQITSAVHKTPVVVPEAVTEPSNTQEDGKTEKVQWGEDYAPTQTESDSSAKRGRAPKRNIEKI